MQFLADCPWCKDKVTTITVLRDVDLDRALENDEDVEVVCFPRDHKRKLNEQEKANLRNQRKRMSAGGAV